MKNLYFLLLLLIFSMSINAQNNALHFDGTTDYVSLATPLLPTVSANDAWTMEVKIKTVTTDYDIFFSQYLSTDNNSAIVNIKYGKIIYWKAATGDIVQSSANYNDGLWHHIAIVKEGSGTNQVHLYIDGVLIDSGTDSNPIANLNSEIGKNNHPSSPRNFPGRIDEFRVWNTARTQTEIQANKDIELVGTETGLTAYYNFNEGVANADNTGVTTLNDITTNANDGTLHSFSLNGNESNWVGQYPQNDTCATSTNITVSNTLFTQSIDEIVFSSMTNETLCADPNPQNYYDLWYDFTLASDTNVYIYGNNQSYNRFVLYDACLGTEIICFSNKKLLQLQSGINYKLRVFKKESERLFSSGSGAYTFTIQSFDQPTNDACVDSESIILTETLTNYDFDLRGATPDTEASCTAAGTYYDVWYDFTMPATPSNLYLKGRQYGGNEYAIYDACGGAEVACFNAATTSYGSELLTNLTAGATYKLRVYRTEAHTGDPSGLVHNKFEIRTYPKIDNTTCATATNITVTTSNTNTATNFGGANLLENEVRCSSTGDYYDAWYTFTMPVSGNLIISSSAATWNKYELFDACAGASIICSSGNATIQNLVAGNTYKLRISREESNVKWNPSDDNVFTVKALAIANNDTCATAENITVSETENTVNFEIISAQLNTEEGCSGSATQSYADIWYKFTMPSFDGGSITQGNILIDGTAFYNKFTIYDACGGAEIDCFEESKIVENLTSGTNYKIRLYRTAADYTLSSYKSFTIKAFADAQNDDCASSENIAVTTTATTINFELGGVASNLETICGTEDTYVDVWYDFTVPEAGDIQITTSASFNRFELVDACAGTQIGCFTGGNASFTNLVSGTNYKLRVFRKQINNQDSGASFNIVFQSILGVDDFDLSNKVNIYPNPTSDVINIQSQLTIDAVELYDVIGKKVLRTNQTQSINISHLQTGVYFLKVTENEGSLVKRIVIK